MSALRSAQSRHSAGQYPRHGNGHGVHPAQAAEYTIAHAGRQVRIGPVAFWIVVGTVVIMATWSVATATYFAFREDVLKGLIARQSDMQSAYEDRIAELRARIDRTTSRQLLDQEQFEQKLDDLMRRQATLESRANALSSAADPMPTGSIRSSSGSTKSLLAPQNLDRRSYLDSEQTRVSRAEKTSDIGAKLGRIEAALNRVDHRQSGVLASMEQRYEGRARKLRNVLAELGLKIRAPTPGATGGPFVPVKLPGDSNGFERTLTQVNQARAQADQLDRALVWIPLRKPVSGEIDLSSTFGVRTDPFLRVPAMHTGLDFRGDAGDPIRVTAAGTVSSAGWSGGYGRMVEVEHGNGLATRYGHLSQIDVRVGDKVHVGQIIGRMGSTGRSTGPHLHYETRIEGEAVDPQKFLTAGAKIFGD
jgi:murein DD-endopeptidase MepM/ murein hydrolase activator NlpD